MFPQLSDETKPDTNDVLEHDPSISVEGRSENGGATAVFGDGEGERRVNGESVAAGSELTRSELQRVAERLHARPLANVQRCLGL